MNCITLDDDDINRIIFFSDFSLLLFRKSKSVIEIAWFVHWNATYKSQRQITTIRHGICTGISCVCLSGGRLKADMQLNANEAKENTKNG